MASETITPNMNLIVPAVGVTEGPLYATDINQTLTLIDQHNHSPGFGVPVNPAGMSINSDLTFQSNNGTAFRSVRFAPNASPLSLGTDLGALYEAGVDLWYNDGNGNQIRITQSGGVVGTPGSISGLTPPASVTYVSATPAFVFQSNAGIAANLDAGSVTFRNVTPNSTFGVTVQPVASLSSNYTLVLPTLPASQKIMTLDNAGNISAPYTVDGSTIVIVSNVIQVGTVPGAQIVAGSITNTQISNTAAIAYTKLNLTGQLQTTDYADASITTIKLAAAPQAHASSASGTVSTLTTIVQVTVSGLAPNRPVIVSAQGNMFGTDNGGGGGVQALLFLGGTAVFSSGSTPSLFGGTQGTYLGPLSLTVYPTTSGTLQATLDIQPVAGGDLANWGSVYLLATQV